jgi:hypothetical protein
MPALQTFDRALADSAAATGKEWSDERLAVVGELAAQLSDDELALVRVIWRDRPIAWQKHCAQVLGWVRRGAAIEILMEMVGRGPQAVALDALESLSEFDPGLFQPDQTVRLVAAIETLLARPLAPLHQALLEKFLARLRSAGGAAE